MGTLSSNLDLTPTCARASGAHRARLETLREQQAELLNRRLATQADTAPDTADLDALADQPDQIIATGSPEQAKELLRLLVKEIRVHNRRIILTYRIPATVRAIPCDAAW